MQQSLSRARTLSSSLVCPNQSLGGSYYWSVTLGHQIPIQHQDQPSLQSDMKGPKPVDVEIPTEDGGYQTYKAAGKLKGKKVS